MSKLSIRPAQVNVLHKRAHGVSRWIVESHDEGHDSLSLAESNPLGALPHQLGNQRESSAVVQLNLTRKVFQAKTKRKEYLCFVCGVIIQRIVLANDWVGVKSNDLE